MERPGREALGMARPAVRRREERPGCYDGKGKVDCGSTGGEHAGPGRPAAENLSLEVRHAMMVRSAEGKSDAATRRNAGGSGRCMQSGSAEPPENSVRRAGIQSFVTCKKGKVSCNNKK